MADFAQEAVASDPVAEVYVPAVAASDLRFIRACPFIANSKKVSDTFFVRKSDPCVSVLTPA